MKNHGRSQNPHKLRQGSAQLKCLHLAGRFIYNSLHRGDTNAPKLSTQMKMKRSYLKRTSKNDLMNIYMNIYES